MKRDFPILNLSGSVPGFSIAHFIADHTILNEMYKKL